MVRKKGFLNARSGKKIENMGTGRYDIVAVYVHDAKDRGVDKNTILLERR